MDYQNSIIRGLLIFIYILTFFILTPIIMKWIYSFHKEYGIYHHLPGKQHSEESSPETLLGKIHSTGKYYLVIGASALVSSTFLNTFGLSFSLGGVLGGEWNQPASILFMEVFILMVFSNIRIVSLSELGGRLHGRRFNGFNRKINGYLFSFLFTSYLLFMYQLGRIILNGNLTHIFFVEIRLIDFLFLFVGLLLPYPVAAFTELFLTKGGVVESVKGEK